MKNYDTIKGYEYSSIKEYQKHRKIMEKNGWILIENGMFRGIFDPQTTENGIIDVHYIKSTML